MSEDMLLNLAADIVAAHVSNNKIANGELAGLIQTVYGSLAALGQPPKLPVEKQEPAVSIRASVKNDIITCLDCGQKAKMLKRHLMTSHGLTPQEYRAKWQLPNDYPLVAPNYAKMRQDLAQKIGLGRIPRTVGADSDSSLAPEQAESPAGVIAAASSGVDQDASSSE